VAIPLRPITRVQDILKELNLDITYTYDDLVFAEHNAFILQFGEKGEEVFLHFNTESDPEKRCHIEEQIKSAGLKQEIKIIRKGLYVLEQVENEKMKLTFQQ
jgi:hypothetical protein